MQRPIRPTFGDPWVRGFERVAVLWLRHQPTGPATGLVVGTAPAGGAGSGHVQLDRRASGRPRRHLQPTLKDRGSLPHAVQAEAAGGRGRIEAHAVVADLDPDLSVDDLSVDPDMGSTTVARRVADRLLDDPIGIDFAIGLEEAGRQDRRVQPDLDRDPGPVREIAQGGAETDLMDSHGAQSHGDVARFLERGRREDLGASDRRLSDWRRAVQGRLRRVQGQDHCGQRLADAVVEVPSQACAFVLVSGVQPVASLPIEQCVALRGGREEVGHDRDDNGDRDHQRPLGEIQWLDLFWQAERGGGERVAHRNDRRDQDPGQGDSQAVDEGADRDGYPQRMEQDLGVADPHERGQREQVRRSLDHTAGCHRIEARPASRTERSTNRAHDHS